MKDLDASISHVLRKSSDVTMRRSAENGSQC
jgi:hypothetical protein